MTPCWTRSKAFGGGFSIHAEGVYGFILDMRHLRGGPRRGRPGHNRQNQPAHRTVNHKRPNGHNMKARPSKLDKPDVKFIRFTKDAPGSRRNAPNAGHRHKPTAVPT